MNGYIEITNNNSAETFTLGKSSGYQKKTLVITTLWLLLLPFIYMGVLKVNGLEPGQLPRDISMVGWSLLYLSIIPFSDFSLHGVPMRRSIKDRRTEQVASAKGLVTLSFMGLMLNKMSKVVAVLALAVFAFLSLEYSGEDLVEFWIMAGVAAALNLVYFNILRPKYLFPELECLKGKIDDGFLRNASARFVEGS